MNPQAVADWFATERGISRETLRAFNVQMEGENVLFPYPNGVKQRPDPTQQLREGQRRFYFTKGQLPELFVAPQSGESESAFLVEGETDAMRLWQELTANGVPTHVFGIGGINTWREELAEKYLSGYKRVYVILDNDQDYMVKGQVNDVWRQIRATVRRSKRVYLPQDAKDVCEFFALYDLETLQLYTQRMARSRFKPIDFSLPPPPVDWLLEGWIAKGDVTVLAGKGGLGKSVITMGLAAAILEGRHEFLGEEVHAHGKVLYIDEENPADVVYTRMLNWFGIDPSKHGANLRYLWECGIRLDRPEIADDLLDEAMEFRPAFMAFDSLTRLHGKEENVTGDMASIINDTLKPLARQTGAGVVLIHHHDKNAIGPRGSTDIVNAADAVIELYDNGMDTFRMVATKTRRRKRGSELLVGIVDKPGGGVEVKVNPGFDPALLAKLPL